MTVTTIFQGPKPSLNIMGRLSLSLDSTSMNSLFFALSLMVCLGGYMTSAVALTSDDSQALITHHQGLNTFNLEFYENKLKAHGSLTLPLAEELQFLKQLSDFELGRFLLENKGFNGYWTAYMILHGPKKNNLSTLERWLLHEAPVVKATQERFQLFRKKLQGHLKSDMTIASVPCGLMDDLLGLDYSRVSNIKLVGIDLDEKSLKLAQDNAKHYECADIKTRFIQENAWNIDAHQVYEIITSNGLNIYQKDDQKVIDLYKIFYQALKPGGIFITSFLTPPPALSKDSTWRNYNLKDALKQKAIFGDIIEAAWQAFRTEVQTREQLSQAGFRSIEIIYDSQGMFPTVVAKKK